MREDISALVRALRTFGQGLVAAVLLAGGEALNTALGSGSFDPRYLVMGVLTAVVGAAVTYAYNVIAPKVGIEGSPSLEGLLRGLRTLAQAVVAVGLMAGWDSVYATVTGGNYSPADIAKGAVAAVVTAVVAYVHNVFTARKANA